MSKKKPIDGWATNMMASHDRDMFRSHNNTDAEEQIEKLDKTAKLLAKKMEIFQARNKKDGVWLTVTAERKHKAMQQELDKLNAEINRLDEET
jgi:hypothetical protein